MKASSTGRSVTGFLIGLVGGSVVVALALPRSSLAPLVTAILPVLVLVALSAIQGRSISAGLGLRRAGLRFWPAALLIPTTVALLAYGVALAPDLAGRGAGPGTAVLASSVLGALLVLPTELGWRSFLVPRVQELTSARKGALLTGLAESAAHLVPGDLDDDLHPGRRPLGRGATGHHHPHGRRGLLRLAPRRIGSIRPPSPTAWARSCSAAS